MFDRARALGEGSLDDDDASRAASGQTQHPTEPYPPFARCLTFEIAALTSTLTDIIVDLPHKIYPKNHRSSTTSDKHRGNSQQLFSRPVPCSAHNTSARWDHSHHSLVWLVVALVAMIAPLRPHKMNRTSFVSGLRLKSSNHRSP